MRKVLVAVFLLTGCEDTTGGTKKGDPEVISDSLPTDTDTGTVVDTDTGTAPIDQDGDGFVESDDCNDRDETIFPGAPELCDGVDQDCNGIAEWDQDNDGLWDCQDYCPVYASWGATGDGRSTDPVGTLQEAIDLAGSSGCNEVRANGGTYYENLSWNGYPVNMESVSGPGYTIIDGGNADSVVAFEDGETEDARIYGFTITNGHGDGGGIRVNTSSPVIEGNIITKNSGSLGGGIRIYNGSPTIIDNEISENDACYGGTEDGCDGGGLDIRGGAPTIQRNQIVDNTAGDGGGLWLAHSDALVEDNVISGNAADDTSYEVDGDMDQDGQGGGIDVQLGGPAGPNIRGNIIADNTATSIGGGLVVYEDKTGYVDGLIVNNTIVHNSVLDTDRGGGIAQFRRTSPTFTNNIIAFNHGIGAWSEDDINSAFTYNLVYGNDTNYGGLLTGSGSGNLSSDPMFTTRSDDQTWDNDDFHLKAGSPAINAGAPGTYDGDGSRADLGAYGG